MTIGVLKESLPETRVSLLPEHIATLKKWNVDVCVETQAGMDAFAADDKYSTAGATVKSREEVLQNSDIILSIQEWLDKIFPNDEVQEYVLNLFACKLAGVLYKEWMHIFTGSGANGKSQWFKMINKVFGEYFKTFDNTLFIV